jgi:hypothetical protein
VIGHFMAVMAGGVVLVALLAAADFVRKAPGGWRGLFRRMREAQRTDEANAAHFQHLARFWTVRTLDTSALTSERSWDYQEDRWREQ